MAENGSEEDGGEAMVYIKDDSVDLRDNPVLRSKCGGWCAYTFIVNTRYCSFVAFSSLKTLKCRVLFAACRRP
jgi:hypothetical protein